MQLHPEHDPLKLQRHKLLEISQTRAEKPFELSANPIQIASPFYAVSIHAMHCKLFQK